MQIKTVFNGVVKRIDATESADGKKLFLNWPGFYRPLIDEVKAMRGAEWHPEIKCWSVDICKRNMFAFKILGNNPEYLKYFEDPFKTKIDSHNEQNDTYKSAINKLWKHQVEMLQIELHHKRCILAAEMRTGKTLPTMIAFLMSGHIFCWWVTTKKAALGLERELIKWFPGVNPDRFKIMTYDKFSSVTNILTREEIEANLPPFIVFDECHKLKTPHTQRSQAALTISDMLEGKYNNLEYCIGLSGTPAPKDPSGWWTQCEVIRSGFIREGTIQKFRARYGKYKAYDPDNPIPAWERFEGWSEDEVFNLSKRLKGLVFIYMQKDCMDLPPKRYEIIELQPSAELLRVAKMIVDTSDNQLVARQKLRQLSDGFEYEKTYDEVTNTQTRTTNYVGSPKIERLKLDLEEHDELGRIVIYAGFQGSIDLITKTCLDLGWVVLQIDGRGTFICEKIQDGVGSTASERDKIFVALAEMDRSTDTRKIPKLAVVAHPQSGGAGLELSSSPTFIYYSNDDSGEGRMQSESRGYSNNMDKTRGCTIIDYILLPTDKLVRDKLLEKKDLQNLSLGQLKECLDNCNVDARGIDTNSKIDSQFNPPW